MPYDFAARGLTLQNRRTARRLATIDALARGIAENLPKGLPKLAASPPTMSLATASTISGGKNYGISASTPANDFRHCYALYGGQWRPRGTAYPQNIQLGCWSYHTGNGSEPSTGDTEAQSGVVRFTTWADKFEIWHGELNGWRMKVNGEYVQTGLIGNYSIDGVTANAGRYQLFDFGAAGFKRVELEWDEGPIYFRGIVVPPTYSVEPWPRSDSLKMSLFGDSLVNTIVDTADKKLAPMGQMGQTIRALIGQPNLWVQGVGATGFIATNGGTRSNFVERANVDFLTYGPFDVVIEIGGRNDSAADLTGANAFQQAVEDWIDIVLASNPDTIICMVGPGSSSGTEAYNTNYNAMATKQDRKKAAAAKYPRNCLFIETIGNAANPDPWIYGSGKVGTPGATTGNADRLGGDYVHRSIAGHAEIGTRIVQEIGRRLPAFASRIRDGVIAGVNDADLV